MYYNKSIENSKGAVGELQRRSHLQRLCFLLILIPDNKCNANLKIIMTKNFRKTTYKKTKVFQAFARFFVHF